MKLYYSPYSLLPKQSLNSLEKKTQKAGALLKLEEGEYCGYADLHPLIEFGDLPLEEHLQSLKTGSLSFLAQRSLEFARKDLQARKEKISLLENRKLKSNFIITDLLSFDPSQLSQNLDFQTVKIKIGRSWEKEAAALNRLQAFHFRIRLDANSNFTEKTFHEFLNSLDEDLLKKIEYVEDPTPYDMVSWKEFQKRVSIAIDFEIEKAPKSFVDAGFSAIILKPARQNVEDLVDKSLAAGLKMTFTSSMDHLVGIAHAVSVAEKYQKKYPDKVLESGFLTSDLFQENPFSSKVHVEKASLCFSFEEGIGFSEELKSCDWLEL